MNPTDSVLVVVVLLVLLQLLNHPFPGKVVGKVILGYHHYAKSLLMIHYYTKLSVWIWTLQIYFLISSFISSNSMYVIHKNGIRDACSTADMLECPRHASDDAPDMYYPRHAPDDAPDMHQMMPQTCPKVPGCTWLCIYAGLPWSTSPMVSHHRLPLTGLNASVYTGLNA